MVDFTTFANTINGESRVGSRQTRGTDPSTKELLWPVPVASKQDIDDAVASAQESFPNWSKSSWTSRQELLKAARATLLANRTEMATLLVKECGKPIEFANLEIDHATNYLEFNAKEPPLDERVIQDDAELKLTITQKPIGVVAAICPWNYPLVLAVSKVAAALVTGNCVIVKPSPFSPYTMLKFTELVRHHFPPGVFQVLNGDNDLGPYLCVHPGIDKISFTGSTATGKKIVSSTANTLKRLTLELGGNSACIVCPDVEPKVVAPQVAIGAFFNSGQLCMASKRVYVHEDIYDEFLEAIVGAVSKWKVGPTSTTEQGIMLGPIQNDMQYNKVKRILQSSIDGNHQFALRGDPGESNENLIISPSIIDNPPDDSPAVVEEAFGPILPILKWRNLDDVITRVNNTLTGLGGTVWSKDIAHAQEIADRIEAGTVWINSFEKPLPQAHLAGYKESGLGGEWGREGLLSYCKPQVVHCYKSPVVAA